VNPVCCRPSVRPLMNPSRRWRCFPPAAAALAALWACGVAQAETPPPSPRFPLDVTVVDGRGRFGSGGPPGSDVSVLVRNTTTLAGAAGVALPLQAFVLLGVRWADLPPPDWQWRVGRAGQVTRGTDGGIRFRADPAARDALVTEKGLLPPGHARAIPLPIDTRSERSHEVVIEYATVAPGRDWRDEVLLRTGIEGDVETFVPAAHLDATAIPGVIEAAVLNSSLQPGAAPPAVQTLRVVLPLPAPPPPPPPVDPADERAVHRLDWRGYDGTGDPATARFLFDGEEAGTGPGGFAEVRRRIEALPRGSHLMVIPYYGDPGGSRRRYPFELEAVLQHAERSGIRVERPEPH